MANNNFCVERFRRLCISTGGLKNGINDTIFWSQLIPLFHQNGKGCPLSTFLDTIISFSCTEYSKDRKNSLKRKQSTLNHIFYLALQLDVRS